MSIFCFYTGEWVNCQMFSGFFKSSSTHIDTTMAIGPPRKAAARRAIKTHFTTILSHTHKENKKRQYKSLESTWATKEPERGSSLSSSGYVHRTRRSGSYI